MKSNDSKNFSELRRTNI